jgi:hypothetical protein
VQEEEDGGGDAQPGCSLPLPQLPLEALTNVLLRLPLDERLRLAEVCCGWRGMLSERSLWMHLDVSAASLGAACRASDALLRAGAARALRNVRSVDVSGVLRHGDGERGGGSVSVPALCDLAALNPGLRVIRALCGAGADATQHGVPLLRTLLAAAPRLAELHADVWTRTLRTRCPFLQTSRRMGPCACAACGWHPRSTQHRATVTPTIGCQPPQLSAFGGPGSRRRRRRRRRGSQRCWRRCRRTRRA